MFKERIDKERDEIVKDLLHIMNINTSRSIKKPNMPFGEGSLMGLKYILDKGSQLQFKYQNYCGYCGMIEVGNGPYTVGVMCNIDTVSDYPCKVEGNIIYGPGATGGKGSAIACLYAMKILSQEGCIPDGKKVRMIVLSDKETGYKGINYYKEYEEAPEIGFVTDGTFPVIYGEKGTVTFDLEMKFDTYFDAPVNVVEISGGESGDTVPDSVNIILSCEEIFRDRIGDELKEFCERENLEYNIFSQNKLISIELKGKKAPGYEPEKGKNAVSYGIKFLSQIIDYIDRKKFVAEYARVIGTNYYCEGFEKEFSDEDSGRTTFNVGKINLINDRVTLSIDVRFPISAVYSDVLESIKDEFKYSAFEITNLSHMRPVSFSEDSFVVKKLMRVYNEVTGDEGAMPYVTYGTSYARTLSNMVSFGPYRRDITDADTITIDYLLELTEIYTKAIYELLK